MSFWHVGDITNGAFDMGKLLQDRDDAGLDEDRKAHRYSSD